MEKDNENALICNGFDAFNKKSLLRPPYTKLRASRTKEEAKNRATSHGIFRNKLDFLSPRKSVYLRDSSTRIPEVNMTSSRISETRRKLPAWHLCRSTAPELSTWPKYALLASPAQKSSHGVHRGSTYKSNEDTRNKMPDSSSIGGYRLCKTVAKCEGYCRRNLKFLDTCMHTHAQACSLMWTSSRSSCIH